MSDDIIFLPAWLKYKFLVKLSSRWFQSVSQTTPPVLQGKCGVKLVIYSKQFLQSTANSIKIDYSDLCKGHWSHLEAISSHKEFFANNVWLKKRYRRGVGLIAFLSSRCVEWRATWPIWVTLWPWPEVKFLPWSFGINKSIIHASRRKTHDGATIADSLSFLVQKLFAKKRFFAKKTILPVFYL